MLCALGGWGKHGFPLFNCATSASASSGVQNRKIFHFLLLKRRARNFLKQLKENFSVLKISLGLMRKQAERKSSN
jgi:hypothetical protein